jgi:predicted porin
MMSRKVLALAAAAALAAPAVASAAEFTGPKIYGRIHVSLNQMDNGPESVLNLSDNSSRLGVKGDMAIAEGLKAFYQMEAGFEADDGGGELASRNTFIGLAGAFGSLQAGQFDTLIKAIGSKVNLFGDTVGDNGNIIAGIEPDFDQREDNMIQYTTPAVGGMQAGIAYSTNVNSGSASDDADEDSWMAALSYTGVQNLYLGLGYQQYGADAGAGGEKSNIVRLGAQYKMGDLLLSGLVQRAADVEDASGAVDDVLAYGLGAAYNLGKLVLKGQYYMLDADNDAGANMIALGVDYKLAKNFTTYIAYARLNNDDNAALIPYDDGINDELDPVAGSAGETTQGLGVGAIYKF